MSPWMWVTGALMMVLFWGGFTLLVVWGIKAISRPSQISSGNALEVLRTRLAAGDITPDEYEKTRRVLQV